MSTFWRFDVDWLKFQKRPKLCNRVYSSNDQIYSIHSNVCRKHFDELLKYHSIKISNQLKSLLFRLKIFSFFLAYPSTHNGQQKKSSYEIFSLNWMVNHGILLHSNASNSLLHSSSAHTIHWLYGRLVKVQSPMHYVLKWLYKCITY